MSIQSCKKCKDKYVFDLYLFLESNIPRCVKLVNEKVYHKRINGYREIDLMTKNYIIEVKSGKVRHKTHQFLAQINLANDLNKKHVVFAPDISSKKLHELKEKNIDVCRTKEEILERIKK